MPNTAISRQRRILELLDQRRMLSIAELTAELEVSAMTVHRDLNKLAAAGQLVKTHGGVSLPLPAGGAGALEPCAMCHRAVSERTAVIIQSQGRGRLAACCPHCGLALLARVASAEMALVTDFLFGRMVRARGAGYLVGSAVSCCCEPGILAFATLADADRFRQGFGGEVMDYAQVQERLHCEEPV